MLAPGLQGLFERLKSRGVLVLMTDFLVDDVKRAKKTLSQAQKEVLELKKELAFYKSIVAPEQGKPSIVIQTIQLKKGVAGDFDYKIMVSQQGSNERFARGTVDVSIEGKNQGAKQVLALTTIRDRVSKVMKRNPDKPVLIWGDEAVPYGEVVTVMVALQQAGAPSVGLVTENPE